MKERPSWDSYFLNIAKEVSSRSMCLKREVGAVIVNNRRILATGYNGPVRGADHCETCAREGVRSGTQYDECPAVHAEANALLQAAKHGTPIHGGEMYVTACPCYQCAKMIVNAGILLVIIPPGDHIIPKVVNFLESHGVIVGVMNKHGGILRPY